MTLDGDLRRKIHMIASITANAKANPNSGEATIGISTLSQIVGQCTIPGSLSSAE